jgi:predicted AAA+ superfamily ATPase
VGNEGLQFENLVACHLLKNAHWQQDTRGASVDLHYIRTKDDAEVDFCLSEGDTLTHLVECKLTDTRPHSALVRFSEQWPQAQAIQLVRDCKVEADIGRLQVRDASKWLAELEV